MLHRPSAPVASVSANTRFSMGDGTRARPLRARGYRPEAVHAAEIVSAVHRARPASPGAFARSTPIIAFLVTSFASSASLQPSVPGGRSGRTRKRTSEVEPHPDLDVVGQLGAEFGEHAARVGDRARAVRRRLVPDRRQPEYRPGVTGAERRRRGCAPSPCSRPPACARPAGPCSPARRSLRSDRAAAIP